MKKGTILSGMRPTGRLHLGNYFGALKNWVELQDEYTCYFEIADWHALTTGYEDTADFKDNIDDIVTDWLSAGLDPKKCTMFLQSDIKEHCELHLLLSMVTPLSWLYRCPTYKDQMSQLKEKDIATYGFLGYPCLMASDIMVYKADAVPVGEDQIPHLELTREMVRRFNFLYREVFPEPKPLLTKARVLPGIDGRKMSKSYNNTIAISDGPDEIKKKVTMMVTDPARIRKDDPGHPEVCTVFKFHKVFSEDRVTEIEEGCRGGKIGCVQCKRDLTNRMIEYMEPVHKRRKDILARPDIIREVLKEGSINARYAAARTMEEVRNAMNIDWSAEE